MSEVENISTMAEKISVGTKLEDGILIGLVKN